jgi:hypothetical protein
MTEAGSGLSRRNHDGLKDRSVIKSWMTFYNAKRPYSALDRHLPKGNGGPMHLSILELRQHVQTVFLAGLCLILPPPGNAFAVQGDKGPQPPLS